MPKSSKQQLGLNLTAGYWSVYVWLCVGLESSSELVQEEHRHLLSKHVSRVQGIREILSRDRMKVVFFGR